MAMTTNSIIKPLPRAMLIDMDDTILSAYGRPEIAWNTIAEEFAEELAPLPPPQVATAVLAYARQFWSNAGAEWRMKLGEARRLTVRGGFASLAARGQSSPDDFGVGDRKVRGADCVDILPRAKPKLQFCPAVDLRIFHEFEHLPGVALIGLLQQFIIGLSPGLIVETPVSPDR